MASLDLFNLGILFCSFCFLLVFMIDDFQHYNDTYHAENADGKVEFYDSWK